MFKFLKIFFLLGVLLVWSGEVLAKNWYFNDGLTTNDVYCTAIGGANGATGLTPNSPISFGAGLNLKKLI